LTKLDPSASLRTTPLLTSKPYPRAPKTFPHSRTGLISPLASLTPLSTTLPLVNPNTNAHTPRTKAPMPLVTDVPSLKLYPP